MCLEGPFAGGEGVPCVLQICEQGCAALCVLALRKPENCSVIMEGGGALAALQAMKAHPREVAVQVWPSQLLLPLPQGMFLWDFFSPCTHRILCSPAESIDLSASPQNSLCFPRKTPDPCPSLQKSLTLCFPRKTPDPVSP